MWSATTAFSRPIKYHNTTWYYTCCASITHSLQPAPNALQMQLTLSASLSFSFKYHAHQDTFEFLFFSSAPFICICLSFLSSLLSHLPEKSFHPHFQGTIPSTHFLLSTNPANMLSFIFGVLYLTNILVIIFKIFMTHNQIYKSQLKKNTFRSSCCGSAVTNSTSILEDMGSIPGPTRWVKDLVLAWAVV